MRLAKAQVTNFRSIHDSGVFEIEPAKTILVGANEAGKSAILLALQHLKRPDGVEGIQALRDFPRSKFHLIREKKVDPATTLVIQGWYELEPADLEGLPPAYHNVVYFRSRYL